MPALPVIRSWISGSGSAAPSAGSSSISTISGTAQAERAGELARDDLGDERLHPLPRAAELEHVEAVVIGLHQARERAPLAQRRDITRGGHRAQFRHPGSLSPPTAWRIPPLPGGCDGSDGGIGALQRPRCSS